MSDENRRNNPMPRPTLGFGIAARRLFGALIALLSVSMPVSAATFFVTPADNLQTVVNTAGTTPGSAHTISFGPGTYPASKFPITLGSLWPGKTLTLVGSSGAASTILDGGGSTHHVNVQTAASGAHIIFDGLTFQNGSKLNGGAITVAWTEITVRDCVFTGNFATRLGGAISIGGNANFSQRNAVLLHVESSTFLNNDTTGDGAAIVLSRASGEITGSTFTNNDATGSYLGALTPPRGLAGAVLASEGGTFTVHLSAFTNNDSNLSGGALHVFKTNATITNSDFTTNTAVRTVSDPPNKGDGGAIHCETQGENHTYFFEGNDFLTNTAGGKGGGVSIYSENTASSITFRDNLVQGNNGEKGGGLISFGLSTSNNTVQVVENNRFINNTASQLWGAAALTFTGDTTFENNEVRGNSTGATSTSNYPGLYFDSTKCTIIAANEIAANINNGTTGFLDGAVRLKNVDCATSPDVLVENNFFYLNRGGHSGALTIIGTDTDVVGNTFVDNTASVAGMGAILTDSNSDFRSNIFSRFDQGVNDQYGIRISGTPSVNIFYNEFFQNQAGLVRDPNLTLGGGPSYATVTALNAAATAGNNQDADPSYAQPASQDFHLSVASPLIDQGDCLLFSTPKLDIDGDTRPAGTDCDMGADEVVTFALAVAEAGSGGGTVTSNPAGINCGGDCSEIYTSSTVVTLTATPDTGSAFTSWSGDADCSDGQVTMSAPRSCTAAFVLLRTLDVSKLGGGTGLATSSPGGITCGGDCSEDYIEGTSVNLSAEPDFGSEFGGWGGPADCTDGSLGMLFDVSCTATFNACSIDSVVNLLPENISGSPNLREACNRLTAGTGGFNILDSATATFRAGNEIVLENGFSVGTNATFTAIIGPP